MDTAYAKGISLLWNSPIRYSTSFFRTWCFLVISVWFSFYFTTCKVEYSIFVWQAALGGYSKGSEKKTEIKLFFCLVIFPSLNYHLWVASVMWPFAVKTHLQPFPSPSTCLLLRSFLSWPSAFFFDGLAYWVEVEKHSDIVCYHLEKETIIYIYISHEKWKSCQLETSSMNHGSWDFFGNVFSRLRMATSEIEVAFGGWGGALEDMKSSTKIAPAHVSSITPASQISLRKFCSSFCYLLFIDSPTSKPPRVGFAFWASPKPKLFHLRDIPILPPSFSGPENTEELMRENCFIIQGNKLSQLSHLQSVKFTNLSTQQAKMDTAYM